MCKPASMLILKGHVAYWSSKTDRHEDLIQEKGLNDKVREPAFVRVEIVPPNGCFDAPLANWQFCTDQDLIPSWYDREAAERATRKALVYWANGRIHVEGNIEVRDGTHWAYDSAKVTAYDSAKVTAYGSAQVTANGPAQVTAYDSAQVTAYDSAQVTANDSAQVTAYDSAQVTANDSAQVTAYGSAQVTAYGSAQVTANDSAKVTAYDSAQITAYGSAQVTAYDSAKVTAYGSATILRWSKQAKILLADLAACVDRTGLKLTFKTAKPVKRVKK